MVTWTWTHAFEKCVVKGMPRDFDLRFSTWISSPQAPDYTIRAVSNFFVFFVDPGGNFATGIVDTGGKFATGGAPWLANISANFRKNSRLPQCYFQGLGGRWRSEPCLRGWGLTFVTILSLMEQRSPIANCLEPLMIPLRHQGHHSHAMSGGGGGAEMG